MSVKFPELLLSLVCTLNHPIQPMYFIPPSLVNAVTLITISVTLPNQIKLAQDRSMRINSFCVPRCVQDLILCLHAQVLQRSSGIDKLADMCSNLALLMHRGRPGYGNRQGPVSSQPLNPHLSFILGICS